MANKIVCPVCGREYLPEEIFVPTKPKAIIRDDSGKIVSYSGCSCDLVEEYICDTCDNKLMIVGHIQFNTSVAPKDDSSDTKNLFNEDYVTRFHKIHLAED